MLKVKTFLFFILLFFCSISAQERFSIDSLNLKNTQDFFADDYSNLYLYKSKDFSFTKYDASGIEKGKIMFTLPFKIQSVENPLNLFAFSENAQEMRLYDQNLVEIQKINFREKFGFITMAFGADLQFIWLLEDNTKRLIKYRFRDKNVQSSYLMNFSFEGIKDLIIFKNKIYILKENLFSVYDLQSRLIFETEVDAGKKLRRENTDIFIIAKNKIYKWDSILDFKIIFKVPEAKFVDKNSTKYFALIKNKLYLYKQEKE